MSLATSTYPAVVDELVDRLIARAVNAQVWDGPPPTPEDRLIAVGWTPNGPAVTGAQVRATLGQDGRRNEDYEFAVHVSGVSTDDSPAGRRALRDDVYALYAAVEQTLTDDPWLGNLVNGIVEIASYEGEEGYLEPDEDDGRTGRFVAVEARVHVLNQLI